ncbi:MAG: hypothetical protein IPO07_14760 [Haliscomenobacter sp.]|nr:hypothetical protein [Haliscomenobacter sp.]MBK9489886.1 hypothetical protein [Haliscomenobacter sp.]
MNNFTGRLNQNSGEVVYNDSIGGLVFDADYDFILKSVTIYPNRTGLRFFTLRNPKGQIQTISYRVTRVGEQKVPLNFKVTRGKDQSLELTRGRIIHSQVGFNLSYRCFRRSGDQRSQQYRGI